MHPCAAGKVSSPTRSRHRISPFRPKRGTTPEAVTDYCPAMREAHGSTFFESKLILGDPLLEIRTVRALREALWPR